MATGGREEAVGSGAERRPLELGRARRRAIESLLAYRNAKDPAGVAAVFQSLADDLPAHWVLAGLLSVASQLVEYLAASEKIDADEVLRALASLDIDEELGEDVLEGQEDAGRARDDARADEQSVESFPASDAPSSWAGPPGQPGPSAG